MATLPYRTDAQIQAEYANAYNAYQKAQQEQADRQKAAKNTQYDTNQRSNYVAYMQNQREVPEMLNRMGVRGGGAETSALRARTNYENNYNNMERQRQSDLTNIDNSLRDVLNTYKMTADENMRNELANELQRRAAYEQQLQEQAENRYAKTISGWNTISGIDNEIAKIQRSGTDTWRIAYLRARRAELLEQGGGSSGGGGGYSNRYYTGGGGPTTEDTGAATKPLAGFTTGWGKSTSSNSKSSSNKSSSKKSSGNKSSAQRSVRYYNSRPMLRRMW